MAFVPIINSTSHVPDTQDWIRYYGGKDPNESVAKEDTKNIVTKTVSKVVVKQSVKDKPTIVETSETPITKENTTMADVELVSPVQGAVQQARAQYARAEPIKRRTGMRRGTKKTSTRRRKHVKRRRKKAKKKPKKKSRKKAKRLRKKVHKKKITKKRRKTRRKKRDIFTE